MYKTKTYILRTLFMVILISFSVVACTHKQKDTEKEQEVVERIAGDVALYQFHFKFGATRMTQVITAANELLEAIRNPEITLTEEEIELQVHKLTYLWLAAIPTTEYVALVNSGEISLVSSQALKRKFKEMNNDIEKLLQFEELQISYINQELRPFLNRHTDKTLYYTSQNFNSAGPKRLPSPFESSTQQLLKDREFANLLVDVLFFTERIMLPYNRLNTLMKDMDSIIAKDYPNVEKETYGPH